ncbi:MAG: hypothetical protein E7362_02345 [Clostridiales bacterium]|nr:hypothetical protein [Clostridiales bacterium]
MKNATKHVKIFVIIALVIIVVGSALFGVFGFNQDVNYKTSYELNVTLNQNIGEASASMKTATDAYLEEKGLKAEGYAFQELADGKTLAYKFQENVLEIIDLDELEIRIQNAVKDNTGSAIGAEAVFNEVTAHHFRYDYMAIIGIAIMLIVLFIYFVFLNKLAGAVSVLVSVVISMLMYLAIVGASRVYAGDFVGVGMLITAVLTGAYSLFTVEYAQEYSKNVGNDKLSYYDLANMATNKVWLTATAVAGLLVAGGVALTLLVDLAVGIQLAVAGLVSAFASIGFAGFMWAVIKQRKGDRKGVKQVEKSESVEEA